VSPVDVVIDDENVVQPDVLVLPEGTKRTRAPWRIPLPVWVAEVLSPSTEAWDRGPKLRAYRRAGVAEVWLVDPEARTVTVHDLEADRNETETVARSRVLSGFQVKISELFAV
jgi:Uma2 family endonuclease